MQRLTASVDRLTQVLNAVANGITVQDTTGKLIFVNESAARLMDCTSPAEAIAKGGSSITKDYDLFDEQGRKLTIAELPGRQALRGVPEPTMVVKYSPRDSTKPVRWTAIKALPVKDDAGKVVLSVNVLEDITAQKNAELQLKDANARITKLLEKTLAIE
jgi:PAS domain-containing protein